MSPENRVFRDRKNRSFGKFVAEARARRGMTQRELADAIGTTPNTIYNVERGRNCTMNNMIDIMSVLGISVEFVDAALKPEEEGPMTELLDTALQAPASLAGYLSKLIVAAAKLRTSRKRDLLLAFTETLPIFDTSSEE
jgi:transcriptional regulator with XRE-family HTH domain